MTGSSVSLRNLIQFRYALPWPGPDENGSLHDLDIFNVNIGTTVKGVVDDLDMVVQTLEEIGFNDIFLKWAPKLSFMKPIGSVSVSGHKIFLDVPCHAVCK